MGIIEYINLIIKLYDLYIDKDKNTRYSIYSQQ